MRRYGYLALFLLLSGCTALNEFSRRSDVTFKVSAQNSITEPGVRAYESAVTLHGNNRDVLASYKNALEFTLDQLGLKKK